MAWKRSSVRSRSGPPINQQLSGSASCGLVAFGSKFSKPCCKGPWKSPAPLLSSSIRPSEFSVPLFPPFVQILQSKNMRYLRSNNQEENGEVIQALVPDVLRLRDRWAVPHSHCAEPDASGTVIFDHASYQSWTWVAYKEFERRLVARQRRVSHRAGSSDKGPSIVRAFVRSRCFVASLLYG